jgi:energy-converting hydrogenase B subunit D
VIAFQAVLFVLVAAGGTAVVLTRTPKRQVIAMSFYGLLLGLLFLAVQAPDVALSQFAVGAVAVPLMLLVTLASVRKELHK